MWLHIILNSVRPDPKPLRAKRWRVVATSPRGKVRAFAPVENPATAEWFADGYRVKGWQVEIQEVAQ